MKRLAAVVLVTVALCSCGGEDGSKSADANSTTTVHILTEQELCNNIVPAAINEDFSAYVNTGIPSQVAIRTEISSFNDAVFRFAARTGGDAVRRYRDNGESREAIVDWIASETKAMCAEQYG